jgi:uncharacterized protein with PhoU and TrkA domain
VSNVRRIQFALLAVLAVVVAGSIGYIVLGFSPLDAVYRLEEVAVRAGSRLAGRTLQEADVGETTGALVLALRGSDGTFLTNPPMQTPVDAGYILIAIGTQQQLSALQDAANRVN